ncbi:hypothetical protein AB0911_36525, partial [Streptomyces nigra]|uniref:hypothetical protein n=1 Tax=Streptomyces nigra TaxID=1827580 RepID=UPI00345484C5
MTFPIPTGLDQQENEMQGNAMSTHVPDPDAATATANLIAILGQDKNAHALAVFFGLKGSQGLGRVTTKNSKNPDNGLPKRHTQVHLNQHPYRIFNIGARVAQLAIQSSSLKTSPGEELILTTMGYSVELGKIVDLNTSGQRNADALRVVCGVGDWESLGKVIKGSYNKERRLPL